MIVLLLLKRKQKRKEKNKGGRKRTKYRRKHFPLLINLSLIKKKRILTLPSLLKKGTKSLFFKKRASMNSLSQMREYLTVAGEDVCSAVTMDGNTATLSEGLKNSLDFHGNLNSKTGDGVDLSAVVGGIGINSAVHIDSVTPSSINFFDASANINEERTMTIVRTLARISKVELEVNIGHTESVLESPAERTIGHILEVFKIHPVNTLRDSTSPIVLVVNNRLTLLDYFPNLLADSDEIINVDFIMNNGSIDRSVNTIKMGGDGMRLLHGANKRTS